LPRGVADALQELREHWWALVVAALLAAAAAYLYTRAPWVEPRYRSSVVIQATGRLDYGNTLALEKELRPLAEQVRQLSIMRQVNDTLHTDLPVELMLEHTRAEPVQDSSQIQLDVDDSDPARVQQLANAIAAIYVQQHNAAEQAHVREERVILFPLDRPSTAVLTWPQRRVIVPAAALLGLIVAAAWLIGGRLLDATLRYPEQVESELELPVLAVVPEARAGKSPSHPARPATAPPAADQPRAPAASTSGSSSP
jgi:capsular polysaccharide biosynthesis protein